MLNFKDIENLAFFKTGEESRFSCNAVFWFFVSAVVIVRLLICHDFVHETGISTLTYIDNADFSIKIVKAQWQLGVA